MLARAARYRPVGRHGDARIGGDRAKASHRLVVLHRVEIGGSGLVGAIGASQSSAPAGAAMGSTSEPS